jgi:predicted DNA-binding ribbon-helix-helix protein
MAKSHRSSGLTKHSLLIAGHRTSVSLEDAFWDALKQVASTQGSSVAALVAEIDADRGDANLSSAIRVYLLKWLARPANTEPRARDL